MEYLGTEGGVNWPLIYEKETNLFMQ